jgi:septal ring factor EnvC (AmiA/AmiB activator)
MILLTALLTATIAIQDLPEAEASRLGDLEREIEEKRREAEEIRERTEEMEEGLGRLRNQLVSTASALQAAERRATALEQDLNTIEAREAAALEERDARSLELSQVLAALQNLERAKPPALIISPDDAQKAALAAISLSSITPRLAAIVEARKEEILRLAALRKEKREARAALEDTNTALAERRRLLEGLLEERESAFEEDTAVLRRIERETRKLAAEASSLRDLLNRLRSLPSGDEVLRSYERSRRDRDLPEAFAEARGLLERPVAGLIAGRYGEEDGTGEARDAVELITRPGAVVTAPFSGRVQWASEFGALGKVLIIDVGGGYTHILIGMDTFVVRKGQRVSSGEPVGVMAQGANAPRLRFQLRRNNRPVDPEPWFTTAPG